MIWMHMNTYVYCGSCCQVKYACKIARNVNSLQIRDGTRIICDTHASFNSCRPNMTAAWAMAFTSNSFSVNFYGCNRTSNTQFNMHKSKFTLQYSSSIRSIVSVSVEDRVPSTLSYRKPCHVRCGDVEVAGISVQSLIGMKCLII